MFAFVIMSLGQILESGEGYGPRPWTLRKFLCPLTVQLLSAGAHQATMTVLFALCSQQTRIRSFLRMLSYSVEENYLVGIRKMLVRLIDFLYLDKY